MPKLIAMLSAPRQREAYAAAWALAWMVRDVDVGEDDVLLMLDGAFRAWTRTLRGELRAFGAWLLSELPLVDRSLLPLGLPTRETTRMLIRDWKAGSSGRGEDRNANAAILAGYYLSLPWSDDWIREALPKLGRSSRGITELRDALG